MEPIDREKVLELIAIMRRSFRQDTDYDRGTQNGLSIAQSIVYNHDVSVRPEGKWRKFSELPEGRGCVYYCSICRRAVAVCPDENVCEVYPYCNCGARMEEGNNEAD